jgi:essential nuclear protein 1
MRMWASYFRGKQRICRRTSFAWLLSHLEHIMHHRGQCRYTTGKLPKAFLVMPHLHNWEEVLFMTSPQDWSPHATFAATKMFVSQLNVKQVQRFVNLILLNKVRDDIRENKRLHFALFQAVKKAVFKPGAFYKGFVLPLLKQGDCTLREAVILSAVLNRVSVPMDHSAAVRTSSWHNFRACGQLLQL